ncbi:MAG: hypothetical protein AAB403_21805, partial [Planctomycetota bacterium]
VGSTKPDSNVMALLPTHCPRKAGVRPSRPQPGAPESGYRQRGGGGGGFSITMRAWSRPFGSGAGVTGVWSRP